MIKTNKAELRKNTSSVKDNSELKTLIAEVDQVNVLLLGTPCLAFSMIGRSKKATLCMSSKILHF